VQELILRAVALDLQEVLVVVEVVEVVVIIREVLAALVDLVS
jgi:hypothetical protein